MGCTGPCPVQLCAFPRKEILLWAPVLSSVTLNVIFLVCFWLVLYCVISPCSPQSSKNFSFHGLCPLPLDLLLLTSSNLTVSLHLIYSLILETDSNQISLHHQLLTLNEVSSLTLVHHVLQYLGKSPLELCQYDHVFIVLGSPKLDTVLQMSTHAK